MAAANIDPMELLLQQLTQARNDAAQAQQALQELQDSVAQPPAAAAGSFDAAAVSALVRSLKSAPDHTKDLRDVDRWDIDNKKIATEDFIKNCESLFISKNTPDAQKCKLIVAKFEGQALTRFKGFTNSAGNINCRETTTWPEFRAWMLSALTPDTLVESAKIERAYAALSQKGSAEKFADSFRELMSRIANNTESAQLHTQASMVKDFVNKLKPSVKVFLVKNRYTSIEEAVTDAILHDNLVYEMTRENGSANPAAPKKPALNPRSNGTTPWQSRDTTPSLPPRVNALLASLGYNPDGSPQTAPTSQAPPTLAAVSADHSIKPGQPIPKLTEEIRRWCFENKACFRCRQKNAGHLGADCPRFANAPGKKSLNALADGGSELEPPAEHPEGPGNE